jgi:hypothetical protein
MWSRDLVNEDTLARVGPQHQMKNKKKCVLWCVEWLRAFLFGLFVRSVNGFWRRGPPRTNTSRISSLILRCISLCRYKRNICDLFCISGVSFFAISCILEVLCPILFLGYQHKMLVQYDDNCVDCSARAHTHTHTRPRARAQTHKHITETFVLWILNLLFTISVRYHFVRHPVPSYSAQEPPYTHRLFEVIILCFRRERETKRISWPAERISAFLVFLNGLSLGLFEISRSHEFHIPLI